MTIDPPATSPPFASGRTLPALVRGGVLDPELAGLAWTVLDGRVPILAAGEPSGTGEVVDASVTADAAAAAAADAALELAAAFEPFLPLSAGRASLGPSGVDGDPERDVLVAGRLAGGDLRRAVRGVGRGFGLLGAVAGRSLADVLDLLRRLPVGAPDSTIGRLGVVLVLGGERPVRVGAAHYLRPVVRDAGGHVRSLDPAVLATWDPGAGRYDHFGWGIYPELAGRLGLRAGDLEREHVERSAWLDHAATAGHGFDSRDLVQALAARTR